MKRDEMTDQQYIRELEEINAALLSAYQVALGWFQQMRAARDKARYERDGIQQTANNYQQAHRKVKDKLEAAQNRIARLEAEASMETRHRQILYGAIASALTHFAAAETGDDIDRWHVLAILSEAEKAVTE